MRGRKFVITLLFSAFGCNALTGLDKDYTETVCVPPANCEAGVEPDATADTAVTPLVCSTNADCQAQAPPTTPPYCAIGTCDVAHKTCVFSAPDDDDDGFTAADCVSTDGVAVTNTGDCDDHDASLYPGHPEACVPEYDDAGPDADYCAAAQVSCLSNGTKSACSRTCTPCNPLTLRCDGQQAQQCTLSGMGWVNLGTACVNRACVNGTCVGSCTPGSTQCGSDGTSTQICDARGNWSAARECTDGPNPGCFAALCKYTLASGQADLCGIAVDATSVYWTNNLLSPGLIEGTVVKVPLSGGTPVTLASRQGPATAVVIDATSVYWTTTPGGAPGSIFQIPLGGGTPVTLVAGQDGLSGFAVNSTNVYWLTGEDSYHTTTLIKAPLGGSTPTTLTSTLTSGLVGPGGIALDDTSVYLAIYFGGPGAVLKVPLGGGTPVTLASYSYAGPIAVDTTSVYGTDGASVMKVPVDGGTPTTLASGQYAPAGIVVDGTSVYWATGNATGTAGTVMKVPLGGGTPTTLASGEPGVAGIALDATRVYWVNNTNGTVMFAPK